MLRRNEMWFAVALLAATGVAGCVSETTAPFETEDTSAPAAVTALSAQAQPTNDPYVMLTWNAGSEADLAAYRVYRTETRDAGAAKRRTQIDMSVVEEVTQTSFADEDVVLGGNYVYAVTAVDAAGNESPRALASIIVSLHPERTPGDRHD